MYLTLILLYGTLPVPYDWGEAKINYPPIVCPCPDGKRDCKEEDRVCPDCE